MTDAEVMTTAIIAAQYFGGNHQKACSVLKTTGYIPNMLAHSRYNRRLHRIPHLFQILFEYFAQISKSNNSNGIYAVDTYPVAVCDIGLVGVASIKVKNGVAKSQVNAATFMVSKGI